MIRPEPFNLFKTSTLIENEIFDSLQGLIIGLRKIEFHHSRTMLSS